MALVVLGVRHHSPACARLVQQTISDMKPRWVLIEGPADFNDRLEQLCLDHTPPVALFSYHVEGPRRHATWAPFCVHSPVWIALREGRALGAEVRFIDLPAWSRELRGVRNRYADGPFLADAQPLLAIAAGQIGYDAAWDTCFELPDPTDLAERLATYFWSLRADLPVSESDRGRETFMARYVRWALRQGGDVLVVCGGFHAPPLATADSGSAPAAIDEEPVPPGAPDGRGATWLIPFDEARLDAFVGCARGLPSPAWYRWVWEEGPEAAARNALRRTAARLRVHGHVVSVADCIAARTQARALSRFRGHPTVARTDLLDAVTSTWVKEALDEPVPWYRPDGIAPGSPPCLVELLAAMRGAQRGTLAPGTPRPPLVAHVEQVLHEHDLVPVSGDARAITVGHRERERLHALERLVLLSIGGFSRAGTVEGRQAFRIESSSRFEGSVLEAARYGPTLEAATVAVLEERATTTEGFIAIVDLLQDALRAGLGRLSPAALGAMVAATQEEVHLDAIGHGLDLLVGLLRHGSPSREEREAMQAICDAALDRGLWLAEGLLGAGSLDLGRVRAISAMRDVMLQTSTTVCQVRAEGVLTRQAKNHKAPADLRGACLGGLASLGGLERDQASSIAIRALGSVESAHLGDYLAGLLALSREVLTHSDGLLGAIDDALKELDDATFEVALPSLRVAFSALPPRERSAVAKRIARRHGAAGGSTTSRLETDPVVVARARALERRVSALLACHGIEP